MIKIDNAEVYGLEPAIRGMRNPLNSHAKSDSFTCDLHNETAEQCNSCIYRDTNDIYCMDNRDATNYILGPNDLELAKKLVAGGPVHAKFRRMITVYVDVTAPRYWWAEMDTYKVGTVRNSCSTMHKIHAKEFTIDDFSHEHLIDGKDESETNKFTAIDINGDTCLYSPIGLLKMTCSVLNHYRQLYLNTKDKKYWWQMIQLLPQSYNQRATLMLNYEVLSNIYKWRKDHKLDCWREFCKWIESLPYSELITGEKKEE